jgi:hypothetical protein
MYSEQETRRLGLSVLQKCWVVHTFKRSSAECRAYLDVQALIEAFIEIRFQTAADFDWLKR